MEQNVKVIYNCILEKEKEERRSIKPPLIVLTVGHVAWYKNPNIWLEVAERVINSNKDKNIEFIWAGNGELLEKYREIVTDRKLKGIKFIGFQEDIDELYAQATVYFQPSKIESFGLSVVEAFSWHIPCVVANVGGLTELVEDNKNGFAIRGDDVDGYEKIIFLLLGDLELNKKIGLAGRAIYEEKFTERIYQEKMNDLHKKIISQK